MADSSEPAFLFLYRKGAVAPVDYLSTFATAPCGKVDSSRYAGCYGNPLTYTVSPPIWVGSRAGELLYKAQT